MVGVSAEVSVLIMMVSLLGLGLGGGGGGCLWAVRIAESYDKALAETVNWFYISELGGVHLAGLAPVEPGQGAAFDQVVPGAPRSSRCWGRLSGYPQVS